MRREHRSRILIIMLIYLMGSAVRAQDSANDSLYAVLQQAKNDTNKVQRLLDLSRQFFGSDPAKSISISEEARALSEKLGYPSGVGYAHKNIGIGHYIRGKYVDAMASWLQAEVIFREIGDRVGVSNMLSNMGAIYFNQGDHTRAVELYLQSLRIAEEINDSVRIATALQNIGAVHTGEGGNKEKALEAYEKALPLFEGMQDPDGIGLTSLNIGDNYYSLGNVEDAFHYHEKALPYLVNSAYYAAALRSLGRDLIEMSNEEKGYAYLDSSYRVGLNSDNVLETSRTLLTIAELHERAGEEQLAISHFDKAKETALKINHANTNLKEAYDGLARMYAATGDQRNATKYETLGQVVQDSLRSSETNEKLNQLLFNYEMDKKEAEIALLQKDKELQQAELNRQRIIRNGFIGGFAAVMLFAGVVLVQRNKIRKGKQLSDKLLLNILPAEVAEELKQTGQAVARDYEMVSILFTDFKDFTRTSAAMNAIDLVAEINACFKGFDQIVEKYDIEKIKTIGDAYMAVAGLPVQRDDAAKRAVQAALEMQQFVTDRKAHHAAHGRPGFEMRVGIHSGPVVAGVVGVKKFQYDIWGDAVNTAARIESCGEPGKVNISHTTYTLVKDHAEFSFESRGMIEAKGKGAVEMWFVE